MATIADTTIPLEPDNYYHIYNKGNNSENLFYSDENYKYFLKQLNKYMNGYFHFYTYCLLPNHFHLLIRVKNEKEILKQYKIDFPKGIKDAKNLDNVDLINKIVSQKLRRFFISYAKSINKQEGRNGSLFRKPFRRKKVNSDDYFRGLVWYIHNNPVKHKIYKDYKTYKWSSYSRILSDRNSSLEKTEILEWFDDKENFIAFHELKKIDWDRLNNLITDED